MRHEEYNFVIGTSGVELVLDAGIDLRDADQVGMLVKKPSGQIVDWIGYVVDHYIVYMLQPGDLDEVGAYKVHAYAMWDGNVVYGNSTSFYVYAKFD